MASCSLCASLEKLSDFQVTPTDENFPDDNITLCKTCISGIENIDNVETKHWHCLNDSIWSSNAAIQVLAWRLLNQLTNDSWAQNLLDMIYIEDDVLNWAKADSLSSNSQLDIVHKERDKKCDHHKQ